MGKKVVTEEDDIVKEIRINPDKKFSSIEKN